ncbi:uncharacterized protein MKK02DRAFT_45621 [Dioszegia hungarica]|uniref:Uncharacterized protein n=1 Tax=Dioszegia hungarica TaxID=4972 RepID=A0AA38LVT2_9TREE|nr:uncharacterized protein MKK02DRAFT_45621 [Dioszegia hungarica]KAI9636913.1 hypothetical protein MKK02DRAFT_45621 [Dioszegia hungarica]
MPAARKKKATSVKKTSVEHAYTPTSSVSTSAPAKRSTRQRTTAEADDSDLSSDDQAYAPTSPVAAPVTSTRSTRRRTKSVPGSAAAAEDDAAGRGGKHAKEVYNTLEIRGKIFDLLDKGTLAGMLRLEKAVTASVAEVLYHTIPAGIITRMSRATARRVTYCDAVRVIDKNAPSSIDDIYPHKRSRARFNPVVFDAKSCLREITLWKKKYPRLTTILHDRASCLKGYNFRDELYTISVLDETPKVHLETQVRLSLWPDDFLDHAVPTLPPSPAHAGFEVAHTIALDIQELGYTSDADRLATRSRCRSWLFESDLDRRVTSIIVGDGLLRALSFDEAIAFIARRQRDGNVPLRGFSSRCVEMLTEEQLGQIVRLLGPETRNLALEAVEGVAWYDIVELCAQHCPSLHTLEIKSRVPSSYSTSPVLSGLPHLRILKYGGPGSAESLTRARQLYRLGSRDCLYHNERQPDALAGRAFHEVIRKLQSSRPEYAALHTLNAQNLDLEDIQAVARYSLPPAGETTHRGAWIETASQVAKLETAQTRFDTLVETQTAAMKRYRDLLHGTVDGLAAAEGDQQAQNEVLKAKYGKVEKRHKAAKEACEAVKGVMGEMDAAMVEMKTYAARWVEREKAKDKAKDTAKDGSA